MNKTQIPTLLAGFWIGKFEDPFGIPTAFFLIAFIMLLLIPFIVEETTAQRNKSD